MPATASELGGMPPARVPPVRRSLRARLGSIEAAALAGIVCAIGWSVSLRDLLAAPAIDAPDAQVVHYYGASGAGFHALVLLQVMVLGTIGFLWFIGVVRNRLGARAPELVATVFFGGGILIAGLMFAGTAALAAPAVLVEAGGKVPGVGDVSISRAMAVAILTVFAPRIATLLMFAVATLGRKTGALPKWLVIVTYVVGTTEFLNVTISQPTIYLVPAWIALVSLSLLIRKSTGRIEPPATTPGMRSSQT